MKKCPRCGSRNRTESVFCDDCGARLSGGKFLKKKHNSHKKLWGIAAIAVVLLLGIVMVPVILQNEDKDVESSVAVESTSGVEKIEQEQIAEESEATVPAADEQELCVSWIKGYSQYGNSEVHFQYNNDGNIEKVAYFSMAEDGSKEITSEKNYTYDEYGRLVLVQPVGWPFPNAEYRYDSDGRLISFLTGEGSTSEHALEYDNMNRLIRMVSDSDFARNVTTFTYNKAGQLIAEEEVVNMLDNSPSVSQKTSYEYDSQGRKSRVLFTDSSGTSVTEYCYDYFPFVLTKHHDSWGLHLQDSMGENIWYASFSIPQFITNKDGVLIGIKDSVESGLYDSCEIGYTVDVDRSESKTDETTGLSNRTAGTVGNIQYEYRLLDRSYYDQAGLLRIKYSYNQIEVSDQTPEAKAINAAIDQDANAFLNQLSIEEQQDYAQSPWIGDGYFWFTAESEVTNNSKGILSIRVNTNWCMGGVNNNDYYGLNYALNTGKPVELVELFKLNEADLSRKLKDIAWAYLSKNCKDEMHDTAHETLYGYSLDDLMYYFENEELVLTFPTYSLGYGASGSFTVPTGLFI